MTKNELNDLIDKVTRGQASDDELGLYNHYLNQLTSGAEDWDTRELGAEQDVKVELFDRIESLRKPAERKKVRLWPRVAAVAAAVTAIAVCIYFFSGKYERLKPVQVDAMANLIAPGNYGATITLANGETIVLDSAKKGVIVGGAAGAGGLAYSDHSSVIPGDTRHPGDRRDPGKSRMLTARTAKGQTYQFTLPDGTKVWLNADSKISFPSQFNGKERKILLNGEGYFEVARNVQMPFSVESERQTIHVLGTHFNVNAYADEIVTTTTLLEGSVKINAFDVAAGRTTLMLKPNEQSILNNNGAQVLAVDASEAMAWKNGKFVFNREPLSSIMRKLSRWYDVEVSVDDRIRDLTFSGSISRFDQISTLLDQIQKTNEVKFTVKGRRIAVTR